MACRRSSEGATSLRRTATTTSRSSPTWRPTWPQMDQSAVGGGHHLRRHCDRLRLPRRDPGCLVTPGCRLRDQPLDRCPSHHRGARRGGSLTGASRGLRASQRPRFAIRGSRLPEAACRAQARGLDGPPGKSLRQRQSGELHENSEGRGRVPDGLRDRRRRHGRSAALHRSRLQCSPAALSPRLPQPRPLRGSTRPAPGQNRSMTLSTEKGALQEGDQVGIELPTLRLRSRTRYRSGTWPPIQRPLRLEAAILSRMRSPVTSRSNWAKERRTFKVSRPMLVVVLKAWVTETKETPCASKSSTSQARSVRTSCCPDLRPR